MTLFWLPDYANASLRVQARMDLKLKFTLNVLKCKLKRFETQNNITGKKKAFSMKVFFYGVNKITTLAYLAYVTLFWCVPNFTSDCPEKLELNVWLNT